MLATCGFFANPLQTIPSFMPAPDIVLKLCETFAEHREHFRSGNYNEFQLRKQFLDPLFEALGWDMANSQGLAPQYRDVIHEDAIKIGPHVKAPDYAFTLHGQRKFFLEAKKPSVNIKADIAPAYQLRRYAWSAKLPLSILSDFEEFAIYDTRIKPAPGDASSKARTFYCTYDQYAEKWDEIAAIFSRDAILKGSFDKYADSAKKKKGTAEVDTAFLEEIERWRELLARNFALRNPSLTVRDLNFAVQKTIDRLVFLRICEDRGTEDYGRLRVVANGTQTYARLLELFRAADARYNSGLFHFSKEKSQAEEPDTLTPNLALDDKTLKDIIAHLYYPESPYEFSVLPADILGSVYERFLGKTIRLTDGHQAKIEEKPEVRKAGGVYYTPSYIVDYIVQNTLGKLLTPETDKPISLPDAAKLKVVDPACGSGSFLIVAYQYLLDWHRDRYAESPEKWTKGKTATLYQAKGGEWRLTTAEKKRILLNNIHGVDIDAAAVEVTKLSLLLKVLEGETGEIAQRDFFKERERILPDLANNIKCGNSLIGSDFYNQPEIDLLDDEARYRVNVFDWKNGFPEVFQQGGFDCVIGNPPYGAELTDTEKKYFKASYKTQNYKFDTYVFFIEQALKVSNPEGTISFITPEVWTRLESSQSLRELLESSTKFLKLRMFGENVFADAIVNTCVFVACKTGAINCISIESDISNWMIPFDEWRQSPNLVINYKVPPLAQSMISKIKSTCIGFGEYFDVIQGLTAYDKYKGQSQEIIKTRGFHSLEKRDENHGKWLEGKDVSRYYLGWSGEWLNYGPWLGAPREPKYFAGKRLLVREVPGKGKRVQATIVYENSYYGHSITPCLIKSSNGLTYEYFLGVINSKLVSWYGGLILPNFGKDVFPKLNPQDIRSLPIRPIDFTNPADVEKHVRMVSLVDKMLTLVPKRRAEANPQAATQLDAQISATDRQIDRLVYELYGLTEEEIALVEGA
jgi:hypothetical protein